MDHNHDHGVIVACDVNSLYELGELVDATRDVAGVEGYKIGNTLGLQSGLADAVDVVTDRTHKPVIFDYQKLGTDVPSIAGEAIPDVLAVAGADAAILFPQAGPVTERATIHGLLDRGVEPIVGGEMTHDGYLEQAGGYIRDDAPEEMYRVGVDAGADRFVVPGNREGALTEWAELLDDIAEDPVLYAPGIGRQGGDVSAGMEAVKAGSNDVAFYPIIGSGIYQQPVDEDASYQRFASPREAAEQYAAEALGFE
jgi:orotidine-5'-phosphate decarboxylase